MVILIYNTEWWFYCVMAVNKSFIELAPGGSMGPRYGLWLLFSERHKIDNNSTTTKATEKFSKDLEYPNI